VPFSDFLVLL